MGEKSQNVKIWNKEGTNSVEVATNGRLATEIKGDSDKVADVTAFNILKVGQERILFDYRFTKALVDSKFLESTTASGSYQLIDDRLLRLNTGATTSSGIDLESKKRHIYRSAVSQIYRTSIILGDSGVIGNVREWGLYDNNNGFFIRLNGTAYEFVRRNNGVDTVIPASSWDTEVTPDPNGHLWYIQYQWLGVGNVYIYYDQRLVYTYNFLGTSTDPNTLDPDLPVRYSNYNTTNSSDVYLQCNCSSVVQEGSQSTLMEDENNRNALITEDGELTVRTQPLTLLSDQFIGSLSTDIWETMTSGTGSVAVVQSILQIIALTNGDSATVYGKNYVGNNFSKTITLKSQIQIDDPNDANSNRIWGVLSNDTNDGYVFVLTGGKLYARIIKAGIPIDVDIDLKKPTDGNFHAYKITYNETFTSFYIDEELIYETTSTSAPLVETIFFSPYFHSANISSGTDIKLFVDGIGLFDDSASAVQISGQDDDGVTKIVKVNSVGRLEVSLPPPTSPPEATAVNQTAYTNMNGRVDTDWLIPNGETIVLQRFSAGAETDSTAGNVVELWYDPNGTGVGMIIIDTIFCSGNSDQHDLNQSFTGDGTAQIKMRRMRFSGGSKWIFGRWEGYY